MKSFRVADAFCARRREGPYRFIQNRSRTSVVAPKSGAAAEKSGTVSQAACSLPSPARRGVNPRFPNRRASVFPPSLALTYSVLQNACELGEEQIMCFSIRKDLTVNQPQ